MVKASLPLGVAGLLVGAFFFPSVSHAQQPDFNLPNPGILPDHPLYGLKKAVEFVETTLTFGDGPRAQRALEVAQIRLAEAQVMAQAEKPEFIRPLLKEYGDGLEKADEISHSLQDNGQKITLAQKIAVSTVHHISVLDGMQWAVPDNAKDAVLAAKEKSVNSSQLALIALATEDPKHAAEIAMYASQTRVNMARAAFRSGNTEDAMQSIKEYQTFTRTGERITSMAEEHGKDPSAVKEIVNKSNSANLRNLQGILDDVPDKDRPNIERAITETESSVGRPVTAGPKVG